MAYSLPRKFCLADKSRPCRQTTCFYRLRYFSYWRHPVLCEVTASVRRKMRQRCLVSAPVGYRVFSVCVLARWRRKFKCTLFLFICCDGFNVHPWAPSHPKKCGSIVQLRAVASHAYVTLVSPCMRGRCVSRSVSQHGGVG
jgi:hypothetical protein